MVGDDTLGSVDVPSGGDAVGDEASLGDALDSRSDASPDMTSDNVGDLAETTPYSDTNEIDGQGKDVGAEDLSDIEDAADLSEILCLPSCEDRVCGSDGCGGTCGLCPWGFLCVLQEAGTVCLPDCTVLCDGLECGSPDGAPTCECGTCYSNSACMESFCVAGVCDEHAIDGACDDGNMCTTNDLCTAGKCEGTLLPADQLALLSCLCESNEECEAVDDGDDCNGTLECREVGSVRVCTVADGSQKDCDDGLACTYNICDAGSCLYEVMSGYCNISGIGCVLAGAHSSEGSCHQCVPEADQSSWTVAPDGSYCGSGATCQAGECIPVCAPQCLGRECGSDGCGGTCGACPENSVCLDGGTCLCLTKCFGRQCGPDGCGGSCGVCQGGWSCIYGSCVHDGCTPTCDGRFCGSDGCGGICGVCPVGDWCDDGQCKTSTATGSCVGLCGGSSGDCSCDEFCGLFNSCCKDLCTACPTSAACLCGDGECGPEESCGLCPSDCACDAGQTCLGDVCCTPDCSGKECGPDGCGGQCGSCGPDGLCDSLGKCACIANCSGRNCGPDGCGGSCGTCADTDLLACTSASCVDGVCGRSVDAFYCVISETCLPSGTENPDTVCQKCQPNSNSWGWSNVAEGTSCGAGLTCRTGQCCPYDCAGRNCGPDGCGGQCGTCELGDEACYNGLCGVCGDGNTEDWDGCNSGVNSEFRVNATTADAQSLPSVAVGKDGRAMIVWHNNTSSGPGLGIVGSLYDPVTGELGPETMLAPAKDSCSVLARPGGGYVLAAGTATGMVGGILQLLNDSGELQGEPVTASTNAMSDVELYGGADDYFAFVSTKGFSEKLDNLLFDFGLNNIKSINYKRNVYASYVYSPYLTFFPDGSYVSAYYYKDANDYYITADGFSASGNLLPRPTGDPTFDKIQSAQYAQFGAPGVTTFASGQVFLTYSSVAGQKGVLLAANAAPLSNVAVIDTNAIPVKKTHIFQKGVIARTTDASAVTAWIGNSSADAHGIYFKKIQLTGFSTYGLPGTVLRANGYTENVQSMPALAAWPDGSFLVVWQSDQQDGSSWGVYARRFDADGNELPRKQVAPN